MLDKNKTGRPIVILAPMDCECNVIKETLENKNDIQCGNALITEGEYRGHPVVLFRTLIGMVNITHATTVAIERYDPYCIILQGTSGGHNPELHTGDIILGSELLEMFGYITPRIPLGEGSFPEKWEYPGSEMTIDGEFTRARVLHSDEGLVELALTVDNPNGILRRGRIACGDGWNRELDVIERYHERFGTDCEEMEGYAVSQVCTARGVPMIDIRIISNSEWHTKEHFSVKSAENCQRFALALVDKLLDIK